MYKICNKEILWICKLFYNNKDKKYSVTFSCEIKNNLHFEQT